jgi:hypothetical protein
MRIDRINPVEYSGVPDSFLKLILYPSKLVISTPS